ncbi:hypothetical protein Glove_84g57 [Diversispora epigaea]|uniref:Uncharacterized protein n=1 Tax=Diversispora epigaea TaxID=1348612 RepID=A0A397J780_9GLOM|nr:hypothetical protein Glove_84g57 [Diversispora epigaea]
MYNVGDEEDEETCDDIYAIENNISNFDCHPKPQKVLIASSMYNVGDEEDEETCDDICKFICVEEEKVAL